MKQTSLEQKILCSRADRVADAQVAKVFLEKAAERPLREYYRDKQRLRHFVMEKLGIPMDLKSLWNREDNDPLTYGGLCRIIAERRESGEKLAVLPIQATAWRYTGGRRRDISGSAGENKETAGSDCGESVFRKESLESRLERAEEKAKEENVRTAAENCSRRKSLSDYYAWAKKGAEVPVEADAFFVNRINMREYFQALSLITGREDDAKIPETLPHSENRTIEELLGEVPDSDDVYPERIYTLLIEPFAKIEAKNGLAASEEIW